VINSTAIFACSDLLATIAYYKEVLGFEASWTWGEPPSFGSAYVGGVSIFFNVNPELAARVKGHQHWISVDGVDALYELHKAKGAKIVSEIADRPWDFREYVVEDLNGYHLRFAQLSSGAVPPSEPFPEGVKIERRKPTPEEFFAVTGPTFGHKEPMPELLERTWNGVVALSPGGEVIGVLRIMWDAAGWFSIWDVAVVPRWQAKRIGSKIMKEALELIREASPGANVHLFTFKRGFYERLGFKEEKVSIRRV